MAIDHRIGNKVIKNARREDATGTRVDPYPYIGIVKNNYDSTRSGRLQVFIPDLGGPPDDPNNWRTVSYASPYQGYTEQVQKSNERPSTDNRFETVSHTYGMWMVPPDIGVQVIVIFIAGDPLRGYWIACVNPHLSHYMLPAIAGTRNVDTNTVDSQDRKLLSEGELAIPVVEFNEYTDDFTNQTFYNNNKPAHKIQYAILKNQGLDRDRTRGVISSSSQRESPSYVFGISTPGRSINDPATDPNYLRNLNAGKVDSKYLTTKTRKGGHTFVMDDGATMGEDQLIRLRTAGGHQILMHDTNETIYIGHATGHSWIELAADGSIHAYSNNGMNFRTQGTFNLHTDSNFYLNAAKNVHIKAGGSFKVEAASVEFLSGSKFCATSALTTEFKTGTYNIEAAAKISILSGGKIALDGSSITKNTGGTVSVSSVAPMQINNLPSVSKVGDRWISVSKKLGTIVTVAPTHEPFNRKTTDVFFTPQSPGIQPRGYQGKVDTTKQPNNQGVQSPAGDKDLRNQPNPSKTFGNLTRDQLAAYYAQIGKSESGGDYTAVNSIGYLGKYQFGYMALIDGGYVKSSVTSNAQLNDPNSWTGKNGITSKEAWLTNTSEQEVAMEEYTRRNYNTMCRIGAITEDQSSEDVAGMMAVAHLLGPGGAKKYRNGENNSDAYGTTGATYFNKGKYAVAVLSPKVADINIG